MMKKLIVLIFFSILLCSCGQQSKSSENKKGVEKKAMVKKEYAIAIHGGTYSKKKMNEKKLKAHLDGLEEALKIGQSILDNGGSSLDAVEKTLNYLEDHKEFNAGKGASMTRDLTHELDASIMDGSDLSCGAVAGVKTVKNPISLARKVMEESPHVFFAGKGAETFADEVDVQRVENSYFTTAAKLKSTKKRLGYGALDDGEVHYGTVGAVALDKQGNLAAATSTGGTTAKSAGRVGDSPIIGAGTYANNKSVAISCTGKGEEFIRNNVAHTVSACYLYKNEDVETAVNSVLNETLKPGIGGIISVDKNGTIYLGYNTAGMFRGMADSEGKFQVSLWE